MAFRPHWRMSMLGKIGTTGSDRFSYHIALDRPSNLEAAGVIGPLLDPNDDIWDDLVADAVAFHGSEDLGLSEFAVLDTVKFARIGADGKYTEDPVIKACNQPGSVTTAAVSFIGLVLPQNAVAISLVTDRRGPSGKGRFYVPMPVVNTDTSNGFRMSVGRAEAIRSAAQTFLNGVNNQPGLDVLDIRAVVASSKGFSSDVTGVRVGRVVDTIRTRRNALSESYTAEASIS